MWCASRRAVDSHVPVHSARNDNTFNRPQVCPVALRKERKKWRRQRERPERVCANNGQQASAEAACGLCRAATVEAVHFCAPQRRRSCVIAQRALVTPPVLLPDFSQGGCCGALRATMKFYFPRMTTRKLIVLSSLRAKACGARPQWRASVAGGFGPRGAKAPQFHPFFRSAFVRSCIHTGRRPAYSAM